MFYFVLWITWITLLLYCYILSYYHRTWKTPGDDSAWSSPITQPLHDVCQLHPLPQLNRIRFNFPPIFTTVEFFTSDISNLLSEINTKDPTFIVSSRQYPQRNLSIRTSNLIPHRPNSKISTHFYTSKKLLFVIWINIWFSLIFWPRLRFSFQQD